MPREARPEIADLRGRRGVRHGLAAHACSTPAGPASTGRRSIGGRGAPLMEQLIWYEEYARVGAPDVTTGFVGLKHAGPTLIACGSEEQKAYHLPRILRGDVVWCQGFSEPNAGSDLASAADARRDRRRPPGGQRAEDLDQLRPHRRVPGAAGAHRSRRRRKHKGITWVICPMDAPGHRHPSDQDARRQQRLLRGLLRQRPHPARQRGRQAERRLAGGDGDAQLRARHGVHVGAGAAWRAGSTS